jgi:hypothetical protein
VVGIDDVVALLINELDNGLEVRVEVDRFLLYC